MALTAAFKGQGMTSLFGSQEGSPPPPHLRVQEGTGAALGYSSTRFCSDSCLPPLIGETSTFSRERQFTEQKIK